MEIKYIKFIGTHCPGCKVLKKHMEDTDLSKFDIEEYNIDTHEGMTKAMEYSIMSVPVLIKLQDGVEVDRLNGFNVPGFRRIFS